MQEIELGKRKANFKDLYERWQIELGDRFFSLHFYPSELRHLDAAEIRNCLKYSPVLRGVLSDCGGDINLALKVWGRVRNSDRSIPFSVGVALFGHVPGTVDESVCAGA